MIVRAAGTPDGAAPADQDGDENSNRQVEGEGVGRDVGLQRGEQARGHAGQRSAEHEHRPQQRGAWRCRTPRAATSASRIATQRAAEAALAMLAVIHVGECRQDETKIVEAPARVERPGKHRPAVPTAAAGHAVSRPAPPWVTMVAKTQRRHGEVEGAQPERGRPTTTPKIAPTTPLTASARKGFHSVRHGAGGQHGGRVGAEGQHSSATQPMAIWPAKPTTRFSPATRIQ